MAWTDGILALAVLGVFFYFVFARLIEKYPALREGISGFSPSNLYIQPDLKQIQEDKQQIWNERRGGL